MKEKKTKGFLKPLSLSKYIKFNSPSQKGSFTKVVKDFELSFSQTRELSEVYRQVDAHTFDEPETLALIANLDVQVDLIKAQFPTDVQKNIESLRKVQANLDFLNKFKVSLPLLSYCLGKTKDAQQEPFVKLWMDILTGMILVKEESDGVRGWTVESPMTALAPSGRVIEGITIYKTAEGNIQFTCGAAICVDGAPDAYGPNDSGSDYTASAGHSKDQIAYKRDNKGGFVSINGERVPIKTYNDTDWWGVWTDNGESNGTPVLKENGYYLSMSSYVYEGQKDNVQTRYVNANNVSFSVLSKESMGPLGLKIGDLVYVYNKRTKKGKWTAFLETRRKDDSIGEISAACADAIGISSNPRIGGQNGDVVYTFYPNTGPTGRFRNDAEAASYIFRNGKNIEAGKSVDKNPRIP